MLAGQAAVNDHVVVGAGVFLVDDAGRIVEMREEPYESEDVLQRLLASYPQLLAGDELPGQGLKRWVLVRREAPVPGEEGGSGRWSLDHLFLDQMGIPTLVEVKRSSDTRLRREVVGQMLDYAANAAAYWPAERIREWFEASCEEQGVISGDVLAELCGEPDVDVDEFWEGVRANLRAGRIRLVFIADVVPPELRRIVEFLNEQMSETEVFAVEIRHYRSGNQRTLVPRVVGQTAAARQAKQVGSRSRGEQWTEESFFADATARVGPEDAAVLRQLLEWSATWRTRLDWGRGKTVGSATPIFERAGEVYFPFVLSSDGLVLIQFFWLARKPPFDDPARRDEFRVRLNRVPGVEVAPNMLERRPSIPAARLRESDALEEFKEAIAWFVDQVPPTHE